MKCNYCFEESQNFKQIVDKESNCMIICNNCFQDFYDGILTCTCCGHRIPIKTRFLLSNKIAIENDSIINKKGILCRNCVGNQESLSFKHSTNNLKEYTYKPKPRFRKLSDENKNNIYLGVELQIGGLSSNIDVVNFCNNHDGGIFYFKRDGSISGYGCEIVTHPCTLNYHLSEYSLWDILFKDIKSYNFRSGQETNTGVHIHINRSCLNDSSIKKIDLFINEYKSFFEKISNRNESSYARYVNKRLKDIGFCSTSRYTALNLQNNNTIQFRIFNGTVDKNIFFSYLEIVHAIIKFIKDVSFEDLLQKKQQTINRFKEFVKNKQYYKQLSKIINKD